MGRREPDAEPMPVSTTIRIAALLSSVAVLVAGCGDATAPAAARRDGLSIEIAAPPEPDYFGVGDTAQAVRCTPELRATSAAPAGAEWTGARIRWFMGTDRARPVDSVLVSPAEVAAWWGGRRADAVGGERTSLEFTARLPFSLDIELAYRTADRAAAATATFACGPVVTASTPQPTIVGPTLIAHPGDLHPGDTIAVKYAAAADGRLWETFVSLYGACNVRQRFPEMARATTERVVTFVIPASCRPHDDAAGAELGLTVVAFDAADRPVVRDVGTGRIVVDPRRPTVPVVVAGARAERASDTDVTTLPRADHRLTVRYVGAEGSR